MEPCLCSCQKLMHPCNALSNTRLKGAGILKIKLRLDYVMELLDSVGKCSGLTMIFTLIYVQSIPCSHTGVPLIKQHLLQFLVLNSYQYSRETCNVHGLG